MHVRLDRHSNESFTAEIEINGEVSSRQLHELFQGTDFKLDRRMDIDPHSYWFNRLIIGTHGGLYPLDGKKRIIEFDEPCETVRRDMVILMLKTIIENNVEGDFVECGVYKGDFARMLHHYAPERELHLFDTFEGFTQQVVDQEHKDTGWNYTAGTLNDPGVSLSDVSMTINSQNGNVHVYPGYFPETWPESFNDKKFAFVHLDTDMYDSIYRGLELFYPRMSKGGIILVHDYMSLPGAHKATKEFFQDKPENPLPMPDRAGSALIIKQ